MDDNQLTLQVCTTDGVAFDGQVKSVKARTVVGDVCILNRHADYMTMIDYGEIRIQTPDGQMRYAACSKGFISVSDNRIRIIATTFEFADDIDIERAKRAKQLAEERIAEKRSAYDLDVAEAKLERALIRLMVADKYGSDR